MTNQTLWGKYRLLAEIGRGGMADVFLACLGGMGGFQKLVVIKLARLSEDPAFVQMFLDEARLAARLAHHNVVQTYEVGEERDRQYMVMEYLDGPSLHRLTRRAAATKAGVPIHIVVQLLTEALAGLEYAHNLQDYDGTPLRVVHRDFTPHNMIVTVGGIPKILDFGIAKAADSRTVTQTGFYRGKLHYMAPEQARGEQVDARADLFSVGVMLAEALTGQPYWGPVQGPAIAAHLIAGQLPALPTGKDPHLEGIIARALAPNRDERISTAAEFKELLEVYIDETGGRSSREQIAAFVGPLVMEDRVRVKAIIDAQLKSDRTDGLHPELDLPRLDQLGSTPDRAVSHATVTPDARKTRTPQLAQPPPPRQVGTHELSLTDVAQTALRAQPQEVVDSPIDENLPPEPRQGETTEPPASWAPDPLQFLPASTRPSAPVLAPTRPSTPMLAPTPSAPALAPMRASAPALAPARPSAPPRPPVPPRRPESAPMVPMPPPPSRVWWVAGAAAGSLLVVVALVVLFNRSVPPPAVVVAAPATALPPALPSEALARRERTEAPVQVPTPSAAAAAPEVIELLVWVKPGSAKVQIDDQPRPNPYSVSMPRDTLDHVLRADAPGYETLVTHFAAQKDVTLTLAMTRVVPGRARRQVRVAAPAPPSVTPPAPVVVPAVPPPPPAPDEGALTVDTPPASLRRSLDTEVFDDRKRELDKETPWVKRDIDKDAPWKKRELDSETPWSK